MKTCCFISSPRLLGVCGDIWGVWKWVSSIYLPVRHVLYAYLNLCKGSSRNLIKMLSMLILKRTIAAKWLILCLPLSNPVLFVLFKCFYGLIVKYLPQEIHNDASNQNIKSNINFMVKRTEAQREIYLPFILLILN